MYDFTPHLQAQFPGNRHVREKTRQSLQKLVADGILLRTARGVYQLNAASPELQITTAPADTATTHGSADTRRVDVPSTTFPTRTTELNHALSRSTHTPGSARALTRALPSATHTPLPTGKTDVPRVQRITNVRLRNTLLAIEIKRRYNYQCQVCRQAVALRPPVLYAEGHHLQPLGNGHNGPDVAGNIMVLCPNHHTMFDTGAAAVEPDTMRIVHHKQDVFRRDDKLHVAEWHQLEEEFMGYHYSRIYQPKGGR